MKKNKNKEVQREIRGEEAKKLFAA